MSEDDEPRSDQDEREAAERKRAVWIVLGATIAGMVALVVAAVVMTQP